MKKRVFAVLLTLSLLMTGSSSVLAEEVSSETPVILEEALPAEAKENNETASSEVRHITGFVPLAEGEQSLTISAQGKPSASELVSRMPKTLSVYFDDSETPESLPVTWESVGEDYASSDSFYFQFSPKWEGEAVLSEGLDLYADAPYISVFLTNDPVTSDDSVTISGQALGASISSAERNSNQLQIYRYLTSVMDFNCAAACGILANIQAESSFNHTATGDSGTSYGICQWHNTRWTDLKNFCNRQGLDWTTLDGQLKFLNYELNKSYPTILRGMKSRENTAYDAYLCGAYWCEEFERPSNAKEVGVTRGNLAMNTYFPKYSGGAYDSAYVDPAGAPSTEEDSSDSGTATAYHASLVVNQKLDISGILCDQSYASYSVTPSSYASVTAKGIVTARKATEGVSVKVTGKIQKNGKWVNSASYVELDIIKPHFNVTRLDLISTDTDYAGNYLESEIAPDFWISSNPKIATVGSDGFITPLANGSTRIIAVFGMDSGTAAKYSFTVRVGVPTLNKKKATLLSGAVTPLSLKVFSKALSPSWSSSNRQIATVDENGQVAALSQGTVTITATYQGQSFSSVITVKKPTLSIKRLALKAGSKRRIKLNNTKLPSVQWSTDAPEVAYVDESGFIVAVTPGTAVITTLTGGCTDECVVTVK